MRSGGLEVRAMGVLVARSASTVANPPGQLVSWPTLQMVTSETTQIRSKPSSMCLENAHKIQEVLRGMHVALHVTLRTCGASQSAFYRLTVNSRRPPFSREHPLSFQSSRPKFGKRRPPPPDPVVFSIP